MASSFLIARAAAGLPSFRVAGLSGGHGAAVLAVRRDGTGCGGALAVRRDGTGRGGVLVVRRDGTGRGGIRAVEFKVLSPLSAWAVKATNAGPDHPTEGADSEEFELVSELKARLARNISNTMKVALFDAKDLQRKYYQFMLGRYAKGSFELWASVTNRFSPSTGSKLYEGLKMCGETFVDAAVISSEGRSTWKDMADVVDGLDLLRRLVSSTLEAPLPEDWVQEGYDNAEVGLILWDQSPQEGYDNAEVGLLLVLLRTHALVMGDINSMLGAN